MKIEPGTLTGRLIQLVPLQRNDAGELFAAGNDPQIWAFMRYGTVDSLEKMQAFIEDQLAHQDRGTDLPFTVIEKASGKKIGMTRYLNVEPDNRALEIGGTWYALAHQRTGVNTEAKFLLLEHAFETIGVIRVQFKADVRNTVSQRALERIGCVKEGLLRDHMILPDGTIRSSYYYSILAREWPAIKASLQEKISRTYPEPVDKN